MATTKNHKITGTLKRAIDYAIGDKVEDMVREDIRDSVACVIDDKTGKVIYPTVYSVQNCMTGKHPYETFLRTMKKYGADELAHGNCRTKDGKPVLAWHFHQNFEGQVNPAVANEIGRRMAEEMFPNFAVVVGTHTNTENTHNHIIVCAWDRDGHKWNQCNREYRRLREVSDRLCGEYGLPVLSETRNQRLIKYKGENGQTHYYEPTARKNALLRQKEAGKIFLGDIGSYRNTASYERSEYKKETNREIIQRDIDRLLPAAQSYEHLLQMLRQIGYTVSDKKKNGDWLEHISFQPPTADKGTRDYKLSDDCFYIRENLEQVIAEFAKERAARVPAAEHTESVNPDRRRPPYFERYSYGNTLLTDIDENVRTVREKDGSFSVKERGEAERTVIRDLRAKDRELCLIDTAEFDRLIHEQGESKGTAGKREEVLLSQINESFHVLRFMEKESLYSRSQIDTITESTRTKYRECMENLDSLDTVIGRLENALQVPEKAEIIEARIERMKHNRDYAEHELDADMEQLQIYRAMIAKYKLNDPESAARLAVQVAKAREKTGQLQEKLSFHRERLAEYERCLSVLNRIDRENCQNEKETAPGKNEAGKPGQKQKKARER